MRRTHLLERLRQGEGMRLTLVCAPAGYGKTTLLGQWVEEDRDDAAFVWLSLDAHDADPVRLWNQVIAGLHGAQATVGVSSGEALRFGPAGISEKVIPPLVRELAGVPRLVLILEDWHAVRNPLCDETMAAFVEHAPESVQIVISSRSDPSLPLARLRARGDLVELRAEQLRLSIAESRELLRGRGLALEVDDVERLTARTEGWAAGLHLASIALREQPDARAFIDEFSGDTRHVLDFLARDVYDAVPPALRDFMLRTSILDRLSPEACDWILEISNSASLLTEIEQANLFLVALDGTRGIYRYHQLFARMLQRELALLDPEALPRLHSRASLWFENEGDVESAIAHAIAARDTERCSALVTKVGREYWASGRSATLFRWLDSLSWPEARADVQLAVIRAAALGLAGRPADELETWMRLAEADPEVGPLANGVHSIESAVALLRGLFLTRGIAVARVAAERALELEPEESPWRRQALAALGQSLYLLGRGEEARAPFDAARRLPNALDHAPGTALILAYLALLEVDGGRPPAAERLGRDALAVLEERHLTQSAAAANAHLAMGAALMAGPDGHGAIEHLERAETLSAPSRPGYWHVHALLLLAEARYRVGESALAVEALESARTELSALPDAGVLESLLARVDAYVHERHRREGFLGEPLSESEMRVLRSLAEGRSLREAARELYLSANTVKSHRRTIYRKLGASTREEALARARELGLTDHQSVESPG